MDIQPGDFCRIVLTNDDDPNVIQLKGKRCQFIKYVQGQIYVYCLVKFSTKGKGIMMHLENVQKEK